MTDAKARLGPMLETVLGMREIVFTQTRQIDHCLHLLAKQLDGEYTLPRGDPDVFRVILAMIHMTGISGHSILRLTEEVGLGVKDAYPVARAIIEGAINVCFIMAKGSEAAEKASRHAEVKAYRDLRRDWDVDGMKMAMSHSAKLPADETARLEAMLPEFTTAKGGEKDWIDETLKQRLDAISKAFPHTALISLNASAFNIYRHASEVLHGSYFSARYFWGLTIPGRPAPSTRDDFRLTLADHQFSVLVSVIFAYAGLLECFAAYVGLTEIGREANSVLDRLRELPSVAEALDQPSEAPPA